MRTDAVHRVVVAYDVTDDRRRNRVAKVLEAHGDRLQYSVFVVDAKSAKLLRLKVKLGGILDTGADSVVFIDLGPRNQDGEGRLDFVGVRRTLTPSGPVVL